MIPGLGASDEPIVRRWLTQVANALATGEGGHVRACLDEVRRAGTRIELTPVNAAEGHGQPLVTSIEQVREDDLVVPLPEAAGVVRPLARFERYQLRYDSIKGTMGGQTHAIGRTRIQTSDGGVIFAYRLALPTSIDVIDPRRDADVVLGRHALREAELHVIGRQGPILGLVEDINSRIVTMLCRNGAKQLRDGTGTFLRLDLPEPVGQIEEEATIVAVSPIGDGANARVRVAFLRKNEAIGNALRGRRLGR